MNALIKLNKFYSLHIAKRWRKSIMKEVDKKKNNMAVGAYFLLENVWENNLFPCEDRAYSSKNSFRKLIFCNNFVGKNKKK